MLPAFSAVNEQLKLPAPSVVPEHPYAASEAM